MTRKRILMGIVCAAFSALLMNAQTSQVAPTRPTPEAMIAKQVSRYATLLSLDAGQQSKATALLTAEHTAGATLRSSMRAAQKALRTAVENNDAAGISAAATQLGTLTAQELQAHATAQAGFYAMLSPTQQAAYKQLGPMAGRMGMGPEGMHRGFGGPGGPQ
ncbi:MAG TPA: Spy/CpxP family protein refolding chaperone [Bryobacteraceae bacterium]|jgi:Spy/CpxP family protein refolding chaperone|nr:Spy/CpxP family protein refolding chaperone [Bryobacteraceae bacterium]